MNHRPASMTEQPLADHKLGAALRRPELRHAVRQRDLLLAIAGILAVLTEALIRAAGVSDAAYLLVLLAAGPLAFRSAAPLVTLLACAIGSVLCAAVLHASWTVTAGVAIALYTVAVRGDRRRSLVVGVLTAVAVAAAVLAIDGGVDLGTLVTRVTLVFAFAGAGELVRSRQELGVARRERAERDVRDREEQLRSRAGAERMQIARELHDTLAHSLVAINVRASVAIDIPDTQDATAALLDIKQASASALRDLRSTLSVLRDVSDQAPTAPAQGLEVLQALVANACTAGVDTILEIDAERADVPAATIAATVRIVQESLTNVIRHADATHARVSVRAHHDVLDVEVSDDGSSAPMASSMGFGLLGMTERATALGGRLQAGPGANGGWTVRARLPLSPGAVT
jgi:signal transduction histidine kinase